MTRSKRVPLLLSSLILGVVAAILVGAAPSSKPRARVAYTIVWKGIFYDKNGNAQDAYTETRYVSSNGNFRSVKLYPDGRAWETVAEVGRGVFSIRSGSPTMQYRSPYSGGLLRSAEKCTRVETVLGYTTCVSVSQVGTVTVERFLAPALNGDIIKHVYRDKSFARILEPVSITLGEPDPASLQHKELPIDYIQYNQMRRRDK